MDVKSGVFNFKWDLKLGTEHCHLERLNRGCQVHRRSALLCSLASSCRRLHSWCLNESQVKVFIKENGFSPSLEVWWPPSFSLFNLFEFMLDLSASSSGRHVLGGVMPGTRWVPNKHVWPPGQIAQRGWILRWQTFAASSYPSGRKLDVNEPNSQSK